MLNETSLPSDNKDLNPVALSILPEDNQGKFIPASLNGKKQLTIYSASWAEPLSLVTPGGGLKQLDLSLDDTDFIWDSIFATYQENNDSGYDTSEHAGTKSESEQSSSFIRVYSNDDDM